MLASSPPPILPPALRPGDTVAVIAPSSPFEHVLARVGIGWLAQRYRVLFDAGEGPPPPFDGDGDGRRGAPPSLSAPSHHGLFARAGYLAGSDARRSDELARALSHPGVRAIFAARGGYGANRFVHRLDWSALAAHPRWIVGFSDVTALHVEAARAGVASLHGVHVTALGRGDARARAALIRALEDPLGERRFDGLTTLRAGVAEGPLFGGNLALLHACAAAGRLRVPEGCILLLEDVTERPYRIDRMLATLDVGGHLAPAAAVVLGDFDQCAPGPDGITVDEVLRDRLLPLGIPVVAGLPIGHGHRNEPAILGGHARVLAHGPDAAVTLAGA
ncbi:S66 peptidase family protein [Sorangium sp. So ce117]|uniref:S66 peptidase family protein n=1 Tax=Sorangium sp. So ce117 TaxID=3133277 RepID=UPI003F5DEDA2